MAFKKEKEKGQRPSAGVLFHTGVAGKHKLVFGYTASVHALTTYLASFIWCSSLLSASFSPPCNSHMCNNALSTLLQEQDKGTVRKDLHIISKKGWVINLSKVRDLFCHLFLLEAAIIPRHAHVSSPHVLCIPLPSTRSNNGYPLTLKIDVGASVKPISCHVGTPVSAPFMPGRAKSMVGRGVVGAGRAAGGVPILFTRPSKDCKQCRSRKVVIEQQACAA
jgi:hypothetical protein